VTPDPPDSLDFLYDFSDVPDLGAAWPCRPGCSASIRSGLTPRGAYALWSVASFVADDWREHLPLAHERSPGLDQFFAGLPPVARRLGTPEWLGRFIGCFTDLGDAVAAGDLQLTCTGEEVAFQILLKECARYLGEVGLAVPPGFEDWPGHGDAFDFDLSRVETVICWDLDVCWLWDADLDGIESDDQTSSPQVGGVNLHPRDWFEAFADVRRLPAPGPALPGLG